MPLPTITFLAPPGVTPGATVLLHDGTVLTVSGAGTVQASALYTNDLDAQGFTPLLAASPKYAANAAVGAATAAQFDMTGGTICYVTYSAVGTANLTTRTAAQLIADGNLAIGQSYTLRVINSSAGTTTVVGGTGVTVLGTPGIATQTWREFLVTVTGVAAITMQSVGTGTNS